MTAKVFVTRIIPEAGLDKVLGACDAEVWQDELPPPYETLLDKVAGIDGLLCMLTDRIDGQLMDAAGKQLKVISQMAVGYNNIDVAAAKDRGIKLGNTPGVLTDATADLTFTLLLAAARRIKEGVDYIREGMWQTWHPSVLLGYDVRGATLGIVGFGRIGKAVTRRAMGFDMRVVVYSRSTSPAEAAALGVQLVDFHMLLKESDFVSLHVPQNDSTYHLINRETLALMKPTAILINTARGGIVDQAALVEALQSNAIGGAALDVTDPEPIAVDDPLLSLPNALVVPHVGSATLQTRALMASMAADNLIEGINGQPLPHSVY